MPDSRAARRETVRYHSTLFARSRDVRSGAAGPAPWTARPQRIVIDAVASMHRPVHAYDLGAGSGRHSVLMATNLPHGSRVTAVDLLPVALDRLRENVAAAGAVDRVDVVRADLERYRFGADDAGLVVAISVVEHLRSPAAALALLQRCRRATRPGGLHVVAIHADRHEVTPRGVRRAPVECPLTAAEAGTLLARAYRGWDVVLTDERPTTARETRGGEAYELRSTTVALVARAPGG